MSLIIMADQESNVAGRHTYAVCEAKRAEYCFRFVSQSAIAMLELPVTRFSSSVSQSDAPRTNKWPMPYNTPGPPPAKP